MNKYIYIYKCSQCGHLCFEIYLSIILCYFIHFLITWNHSQARATPNDHFVPRNAATTGDYRVGLTACKLPYCSVITILPLEQLPVVRPRVLGGRRRRSYSLSPHGEGHSVVILYVVCSRHVVQAPIQALYLT
jgi:hypothetical protein